MSKTLRTQLIAFCVIAAVGIAYVGANYVRLPSLLGIGQYKVYLDLPDTGVVTTFCVVNVPFQGQRIKPPYVAAYVLTQLGGRELPEGGEALEFQFQRPQAPTSTGSASVRAASSASRNALRRSSGSSPRRSRQ